ncbi:GDSL esterase/lipase At2g42990 [Setaria viridis]|uniref:GDSL esterase/lipase At2g42990 n=1 Tax=Setaria viridis TaxID=4556 RepID=UPI003B3BA412
MKHIVISAPIQLFRILPIHWSRCIYSGLPFNIELPVKMSSESLCYWLLLLVAHFSLSPSRATAGKVSAIIVFGDSTVDAGNNNFIPTIAKGNFPPYGRDFDGGVATGRFSNGRLATDFFSEAFGLPSSVPAYLDPSYSIDQLAMGVSFASAGTGLDDLTAKIASVIPLRQQLEYFKEYKERLKLAKGESMAKEIVAEALYVFSIGTNDFILNYFVLPLRPAQYTAPEYVTYLIGLADAAVRDAYDLGARKIEFTGLAPFGCVPSARTLNHDEPGECNEEHNQLAMRFNAELQEAVRKLNGDLAGAQVVYAETYSVVSTIIANPSFYGFENVAQGCCGTGLIETSVLCGLDRPLTCQDADKVQDIPVSLGNRSQQELTLADGSYELHPAPEDEAVAEPPLARVELVHSEDQFASVLLEGDVGAPDFAACGTWPPQLPPGWTVEWGPSSDGEDRDK